MLCCRIPATAICPRRCLQIDMDATLSLLIRHTAHALADPPEDLSAEDRRGLRWEAERLTDLLIDAMFPRFASGQASVEVRLEEAAALLTRLLERISFARRTEEAVLALLGNLSEVKRQLQTDLLAAYQGDPAAGSIDEIILCYPAFTAISTYRTAHILYREGVPLLPRMMTEYAHRLTGIDIHPGAVIGDSFFIDHGTGVVIGETTTIGKNVKLYQHVTLGAKSFETGADGSPVYSGATILGGETRIGNDCVIGGSVWLTHSVPAGKMVLARAAVTEPPLTRDVITNPKLDCSML